MSKDVMLETEDFARAAWSLTGTLVNTRSVLILRRIPISALEIPGRRHASLQRTVQHKRVLELKEQNEGRVDSVENAVTYHYVIVVESI